MLIKLKNEWTLGDAIGMGGFGKVYAASSTEKPDAVAKLVPKAPGASRELLFVDLGNARNVVPIIDSGDHDDHWVLVMPRAEKSLKQHLQDAGGFVDLPAAMKILSDVTTALADLDGRVVHRDLKPENVLLLGGTWCLADFGISRYADATTAPDTHKWSMSPPYAAPERWREERATIAADIYAVGIMAHELLTGKRPFAGPMAHDYREQHLHCAPAGMAGVPTAVGALIEECLYKAPASRPSPSNFLARLGRITQAAPSGGLASLHEANRAEVARRGERGRLQSASLSEAERRHALVESAGTTLTRIMDEFRVAILDAATSATQQSQRGSGWSLRLGQAELRFVGLAVTPVNPWGTWTAPAFDVVANASLTLTFPRDRNHYEGRSHSIWYCDAQEAGHYQWFETAFMISPLIPRRGSQDPFGMKPSEDAAKALWVGMAEYQVAWPFMPMVSGDLQEFIGRWAAWLAAASQGTLHHPSTMPERPPDGTWRT